MEKSPQKFSDQNISNTQWDTLESNTTIQKISHDEWLKQERSNPKRKKEISTFAETIADIESSFKKRLSDLRETNSKMSQKEFEKWEDGYADEWGYLQDSLAKIDYNGTTQQEVEYQASVQAPMFKSESGLYETIEAYSGEFFHERAHQLGLIIKNSDNETKESDLKTIVTFWYAVYEHLDHKYTTPNEIVELFGDSEYDFKRFEDSRTEAHNKAIDHLNHLNNLAKKYGSRPFTPRNFWTSYNQNQTQDMKNRMSYDRHVFEAYCIHAFGDRAAQIERKHNRGNI